MPKSLKLSEIKIGSDFKISEIPPEIKTELLRLGFCEADTCELIAKIPAGPVIISKGFQETALGRSYAQSIEVELQE